MVFSCENLLLPQCFCQISRRMEQKATIFRRINQRATIFRRINQKATIFRRINQKATIFRRITQKATISRRINQKAAISRRIEQKEIKMSSNTSLATTKPTQIECDPSTFVMQEVMISVAIPSATIPVLSVFVNSMALYQIINYKVYHKSTTSSLVVLVISDLLASFLEVVARYLFRIFASEILDIACNKIWLLMLPLGVVSQIPMHCLVIHLGIRYHLLKQITDTKRQTEKPVLGWRRIVAGTLFFCIVINPLSLMISARLITGLDLVYPMTLIMVSLYLNVMLNRVVRRNRLTMSQSLRRRFKKQVVYGNICLSISVLVYFFRNTLFLLGKRLRWKLPLQVTAFIMNIPSLNNGLTYIIMDYTTRGFTICICHKRNQVGQS